MFTLLVLILLLGAILFVPIMSAVIIATAVKASKNDKINQDLTGTYQYSNSVNSPPRKKLTASAVMLLIGTAFIVLSAITFVAANWVKMSPEGKVFALAGAAVMAFAISAVSKAAAKLEGTSISFYIMGTLISVVAVFTAAYYKFFGEWFSVQGDGFALMYAVLLLISAASFFIAQPIYKKSAFIYTGLSLISAALIFVCVQITDTIDQFAPVIIMVQFVITATVHLLKPQKDTILDRPVKVIGDITAVIYAFLAGIYVLANTFNATSYSFFVLGVVLLQLFLYGTFKKQKWMYIFMNIIGIYTAFLAVGMAGDKFGTDFIILFFAFITLVIYLANRMIPKNLSASRAVSLVFALIGAFVSLMANNDSYFGLNVIVPAIMSLCIIGYGMHKEKAVQIIAAIASPILPFCTAVYLNNRFRDFLFETAHHDIETLVFGTLTLFYMAAAALFIFMPKIRESGKNPACSEVMVYANMIAAAAILLNITGFSQLFMITAALCVFHFILSYFMSCNITAVGSAMSFIILVNHVLQHYLGRESDSEMYIMFALFAVLMVLSRIIFPEKFAVKKDGRVLIDVIILSGWAAVIPFPTFSRVSLFLRIIAVAVFIASFIKKNTNKEIAAVLLSLSSALAAIAFMTRPFLTPDSSMISCKINLGIFALLGIACKYIWQNHKLASKISSTIIFVIVFTGLIIDSIVFTNIINKIFVLAVTAAILILSFFTKSKTWFVASSVALVVITVFSTWRYFDALGWWLYLFIVGIILVIIAVVNEACKKNGESVKSTVSKKFSDWSW